jgi:hypothetical protein
MTPCRAVQQHLHRDATTLGEADRLQLEYHLQSCAKCTSTRRVLLRAREAHANMSRPSIGPRGHASAIATALLEGATDLVPTTRPRLRLVFGGLAFAAVVAMIAIIIAVTRSNEPVQIARPGSAPAPSEPRIVEVPTVEAPATLQHDGPVQLSRATVVHLTGTSITAVAAADLVIAEDGHAVHLKSGRIAVEVDPNARRELRVITPRFVVEVTGTVFEVDVDAVTVSRGSVRVRSADGTVLVERLTTGSTWQVPAPVSQRPVRKPVTAAARARAAEAAMREAEQAMLANDLEGAVVKYRAIGDRYRDLPAGETALFTAARLGLRRDKIGGAALLSEYLQRYPNGRYAEHARKLATPR